MPAADALQANLASLLANIHRDTNTRQKPFSLRDFLLFSNNQDRQVEPTVDGFTSEQWTLVLGFQALKVRQSQDSTP